MSESVCQFIIPLISVSTADLYGLSDQFQWTYLELDILSCQVLHSKWAWHTGINIALFVTASITFDDEEGRRVKQKITFNDEGCLDSP